VGSYLLIPQDSKRRHAQSAIPPWSQPRGKSMVSLVNSHTNATIIGWHLWEIDLRFAPRLPPGWDSKRRHAQSAIRCAHLHRVHVHAPGLGERGERAGLGQKTLGGAYVSDTRVVLRWVHEVPPAARESSLLTTYWSESRVCERSATSGWAQICPNPGGLRGMIHTDSHIQWRTKC